jgi:hypothetical protein
VSSKNSSKSGGKGNKGTSKDTAVSNNKGNGRQAK